MSTSNPYDYNSRRRVLFICKAMSDYGHYHPRHLSTGLVTSASLVVSMLNSYHINSKAVIVNDNNDIDREVKAYKPTIVIIEAVWVVPEKFEVLHKLYPDIAWVVRLHSEIPFIANEGTAMQFITGYTRQSSVLVACNSDRMQSDLQAVLPNERIIYLPNYYPLGDTAVSAKPKLPHFGRIDIGCFGAIRPLKNQLTAAVAAIRFGDAVGRGVNFHVNTDREEQGGGQVLKNLRALFDGSAAHRLVESPWTDHGVFLQLVREMDIGIQLSFSETFNIIAADFVKEMVPVVVSEEIGWLPLEFRASTTSTTNVARRLRHVWDRRYMLPFEAFSSLEKSNEKAVTAWYTVLNNPYFQH